MVRDPNNQGFTVKELGGLALVSITIYSLLSMCIMAVVAKKVWDDGAFGLKETDRFKAPEDDEQNIDVASNIVNAKGFYPITIDDKNTMLSHSGDFQSSFTNDQDFDIKLTDVSLIDKIDGKSCKLVSMQGDKIPAGGYFTMSGVNCVEGYPQDPFSVKIEFDYEMQVAGKVSEKHIIGSLRGYFV